MEKEKSLAIVFPEVAAEWNPTKNGDVTPWSVTAMSALKVWWQCSKGHEYYSRICDRTNGSGCPYCTSRAVLIGFNDLATTHPDIALQWHPTKNYNLTPQNVSKGSRKKVWWLCEKGHEFEMVVSQRLRCGCPICANRKIVQETNDLATIYPNIASQWHPTKNGKLKPCDAAPKSNKKVWWQCEKGHEWQTTINLRSSHNTGCPYCSGRKTWPGFNDLLTVNPELAKEWHPTKNGLLTPCEVSGKSGKKVWWQCAKGHEWQATISNRAQGHCCPQCSNEHRTSFPEQAILYYISKITAAESRTKIEGKEIDIYIPEINCGVEYNGLFWHKYRSESDGKKIAFFKKRDIRVFTVKESNKNSVNGDVVEYIYSKTNKTSLDWAIRELLSLLGFPNIAVNTNAHEQNIYNQYIQLEKENCFSLKFPELVSQWHKDKNNNLTPEMVLPRSEKVVWWMCEKGHEYKMSISNKTKGGGCPICSNKKVLTGYNDLATTNPQLAAEWHPTKNGFLTPQDVVEKSAKKVWWQCEKGHEWQMYIYARNRGQACPICAGRKVLQGFNDLATTHPILAKEWHYAKNSKLIPSEVSAGSHKKAWWLCSACGFEWETIIANRAIRETGCPQCAAHRFLSLAKTHPELAKELHPTKNGTLSANDISHGSTQKVWWLCEKGHSWQTPVYYRVKGSGCPECAKNNERIENSL